MHLTQAFLLRTICIAFILYSSIPLISCNSEHNSTSCLPKETVGETIIPMLIVDDAVKLENIRSQHLKPLNPQNFDCPPRFRLYLESGGLGDKFVIDLNKSSHLISDRYFSIVRKNQLNEDTVSGDRQFDRRNLFLKLHDFNSNEDHCHYHETPYSNAGMIAAISVVGRLMLSGLFQLQDKTYHLNPIPQSSSTVLTRTSPYSPKDYPTSNFYAERQFDNRLRYKRDAKLQTRSTSENNHVKHAPYKSNSSSLFVELLVVHDHTQYKEFKGDTASIAERSLQIVNIMNAFYRQLNVFVALVGVVLWVEKDEIELTEDGDATLTNFLEYRSNKLLPRYHHDNAQLITNTSFNGSVVGKALKGPICTHDHSGGVNTDHSNSPAIVAVTLSHELGHNLGMEHDEEDKCKCPDEKCIMSASSNAVHPKYWSSCSIEYFEEAKKHGLLDCLKNEPENIFGPICGNGFVEEGEDCDLGEALPVYGSSKSRKTGATSQKANTACIPGEPCDTPVNSCCDRKTCKFTQNATCAQGPCCDLPTCSLFNATQKIICRSRQGECDLEEYCDGNSEYCPTDVYYHDGIECGSTPRGDSSNSGNLIELNKGQAYCYRGQCASHESQCQLLWGSSGYASKNICYEQNIHGNTSGNCGYNRKDKIYESCEPDDALCGMLHCVHNQLPSTGETRKTGKLNYGFDSGSILTVSFFLKNNAIKIYCHGAIIDAGPEMRDPGLVPDGAACGIDRMCVKQKCVPVYDVIYDNWCPSDCNGNGICDNTGVCHCHDGTVGTSCYQFFGRNFQLSLLLYMVLFFVPVIALIVFAINHYKDQIKLWWFLHRRKMALKSRESSSNQRRLPQDLKSGKMVISEPIPLCQHSNTNRPFYEPNLDPWSETSYETNVTSGTQYAGYRLEPLANSESNFVISQQHLHTPNNPGNLKPVRAAPPPPPPLPSAPVPSTNTK